MSSFYFDTFYKCKGIKDGGIGAGSGERADSFLYGSQAHAAKPPEGPIRVGDLSEPGKDRVRDPICILITPWGHRMLEGQFLIPRLSPTASYILDLLQLQPCLLMG